MQILEVFRTCLDLDADIYKQIKFISKNEAALTAQINTILETLDGDT